MKIYLATDHAGFELKEAVRDWLLENNYEVEDCGAHEFDQNDDYPDFIKIAAEAVSNDPENSRGIIFGGSGQGEAMVANRHKNVRAVVYYGEPSEALAKGGGLSIIKLSREHNNANILSIGARFLNKEETLKVIALWLKTPFSNEERHTRRLAKF